MKIVCHVDSSIEEEKGEIWVRELTPELSRLLNYVNNEQQVLWCIKNKELKPISYKEIFAIQTSSHGLDVSTKKSHYIYHESLSKLKEKLNDIFIEASQSAIFNFHHIDHLELNDNGTIDVILKNQQRIQIARRKIKNLKKRLGI